MRREPLALMMRAAALGDVVHLRLLHMNMVLVRHPDDIKHVLVENHRAYGKKTPGYDALRLALGDGLVTSEGDFWRRQRRIAQPAYHRRRIAAFGGVMTRATGAMLARWEDAARSSATIELDAEMMALTLRIVGECLLGADLSDDSSAIGPAVTTLLGEVVDRLTNPITLPLAVPTPRNRALAKALRRLDDVVLRIIADRRRARAAEPARGDDGGGDLLDMLMDAADEETGERMTDRQLRDEVITTVLAGHETTANALAWTFFLLSKYPGVAARAREELARVLGEREASSEDLPKLGYVEAVVKESMRLYPPVWTVARSVSEADRLGGFDVPAGFIVLISPWVTHRDPRFWPNPEGFAPERFLDEAAQREIPKHAYLPFITGPRQCIGAGFAMMEAQLVLATVLRRFAPALEAGHAVEPFPSVTLRPRNGLRMTLESV
jgi:cytochrome P450